MEPNVPADWSRQFSTGLSGIHPTYPNDGRATIYPPYEEHAPTSTVGEYLEAALRARRGDEELPHDFQRYLTQRVPSTMHFGSTSIPHNSKIDETGHISTE